MRFLIISLLLGCTACVRTDEQPRMVDPSQNYSYEVKCANQQRVLRVLVGNDYVGDIEVVDPAGEPIECGTEQSVMERTSVGVLNQ